MLTRLRTGGAGLAGGWGRCGGGAFRVVGAEDSLRSTASNSAGDSSVTGRFSAGCEATASTVRGGWTGAANSEIVPPRSSGPGLWPWAASATDERADPGMEGMASHRGLLAARARKYANHPVVLGWRRPRGCVRFCCGSRMLANPMSPRRTPAARALPCFLRLAMALPSVAGPVPAGRIPRAPGIPGARRQIVYANQAVSRHLSPFSPAFSAARPGPGGGGNPEKVRA